MPDEAKHMLGTGLTPVPWEEFGATMSRNGKMHFKAIEQREDRLPDDGRRPDEDAPGTVTTEETILVLTQHKRAVTMQCRMSEDVEIKECPVSFLATVRAIKQRLGVATVHLITDFAGT
jgi:hypothetical protein